MPNSASELVDLIRADTDWSSGTDLSLLALLNRRQLRMAREHDLDWLERVTSQTVATSTTTAYTTVAQATDVKAIYTLYYIEDSKRIPIEYQDFFQAVANFDDASKTGKPEKWSEWANAIYLFPTINSAITLERYEYRFLPDLTLTATNNFVTYAYDALLHGAKAEYYLVMGQDQRHEIETKLEQDAITSILKYHIRAKERRRSTTVPNTPGRTG